MQPIYRTNPFVTVEGNGRGRTNAYIKGSVVDVGADGLRHASSKIVGFVDSDDYIDLDMFQVLLELKEKTNAEIAVGGIADINCVQGTYKDGSTIPIDRMFFTTAADVAVINRNFDKKTVISRNPGKWFSLKYGGRGIKNLLLLPFRYFSSFELFHIPYPYLKSEFAEVWDKEEEVLDLACSHRFRTNTDINHWLIYYWQLAEGKFVPQNPKIGRSFSISEYAKNDIINAIENGTYKMICINDNYDGNEFEKMRDDINGAFEKVLGGKSSFEK